MKISIVVLIVVGFLGACSPERKAAPIIDTASVQPTDTSTLQSVLTRIPPLDTKMNVDSLKKMQALQTNSTAMRFRSQGQHFKSVDALIEALNLNPGNLAVRYNLAVSLLLSGDNEGSLEVLRQFHDAKQCNDCFVMLARAQNDQLFDALKQNAQFNQLVAEPANQLAKALAASNWISLDEEALGRKEVKFSFHGLPAISKDGTRIAVARVLKDRQGRLVDVTMHTLDAASGERLHGQRILFDTESTRIYGGKLKPRDVMRLVNKRIEYFNKIMLAYNWEAIPAATVSDTLQKKSCASPQSLTIADKTISLTFPKVKVTNADKSLAFVGEVGEWLKSENKICATHVRIDQVYYHEGYKTFVFDLAYCSERCNAPSGKWVSIRLN